MLLGVTPYSVHHSLTLHKEVKRDVTAEDKVFSEIAFREQMNRPENEDRIRGII